MNISDLKIGSSGIIKGKIIKKGIIREFNRFGNIGRVCECFLEDDTGKIKLVLWDGQIEELNEGITVKVAGYVKEYKGEMQFVILEWE